MKTEDVFNLDTDDARFDIWFREQLKSNAVELPEDFTNRVMGRINYQSVKAHDDPTLLFFVILISLSMAFVVTVKFLFPEVFEIFEGISIITEWVSSSWRIVLFFVLILVAGTTLFGFDQLLRTKINNESYAL
jgi:hypothetical protein